MRTSNHIPPRHGLPPGRRFGPDPDDRPPMKPRDAYIAIGCMLASALAVICLVAGLTVAYQDVKREAAEAFEREAAARAADQPGQAASAPQGIREVMRAHHARIEEAVEAAK